MRTRLLGTCALLAATVTSSAQQFAWREVDRKSIELTEDGKPVLVYHWGKQIAPGVPDDRARCCYIHPLYAPNGAIITDDFPKDHYHHRGVGWMWPVVEIDGQRYDMWILRGDLGNRTESYSPRGGKSGHMRVEDGWYFNGKKIVREKVEFDVHPAVGNRRDIDFVLTFEALRPGIRLHGSPDGKGYGGFNIRFAPRTETVVNSEHTSKTQDTNMEKNAWAEIAANYDGKHATTRITEDPSNLGFPNGWCLRNYGFLGVNFPGLEFYTLDPAKPLVMKYRVTLTAEN